MTDWEIAKSQHQCSGLCSGFQRAPGVSFCPLRNPRILRAQGLLLRLLERLVSLRGRLLFWKSSPVPPKEAKAKRFVDDDVLIDFFARLENATEELKINFRYILALVLMRKKLLKFEGTRRDSSGDISIKLRGQDAVQEVFNPPMTPEKMEQVTVEVGRILNVSL